MNKMTLDEFKKLRMDKINVQLGLLKLFDEMYAEAVEEEPESFLENLDVHEWNTEYEIFLVAFTERLKNDL